MDKMDETEANISFGLKCWKKKGRLYRYFALLNLCILGFGEFVTYDSLGALQEPIMTNMKLSAQEFSYLYSISSWAATILCFVGGFLIDKVFGIKSGAILYSSIVLIGHFIFGLGILYNNYWCALIGRFLFGIGVEFVLICLLYYSVFYFKGKELGLVQCLTIALSRLGSSVMYEMAFPFLQSIRKIYTGSKDIGIVILLVGTFAVASVISTIVLSFMSPKNVESQEKKDEYKKEIKISDVLHFGLPFWLAVISCCAFCMNIYVLLPFSQGFFTSMHGLGAADANRVSSYFSLIGAALAFVIGLIVDQIGREISFVVFGFTLASISHIILAFTAVSPYLSMFLLAMSFSFLSASLLPLYAYIVPEKQLGTAYGIQQSMINLTYSIIIIIAGIIVDNFGYQALEIFILSNVVVGLIASISLWLVDWRNQGNLNWSKMERKRDYVEKKTLKVMEPLNT